MSRVGYQLGKNYLKRNPAIFFSCNHRPRNKLAKIQSEDVSRIEEWARGTGSCFTEKIELIHLGRKQKCGIRKCRAAHLFSAGINGSLVICGDVDPRTFGFHVSSMARPKVHPDNRLRANTACTACRKSKKRCSGYFPCSNCLHKGRGGSCIPFKSFPGSRSRPTASRPTSSAWGESRIGLQSPLRPQTHDAATPDLDVVTPEAESHSPEATHRTHPRMLRNLQGDRGRWPK